MNFEKERIFDHIPSATEIESAFFHDDPENDPNDPRCIKYKRVHSYPKIKWLKVILSILITSCLSIGLEFLLEHFFHNLLMDILIPVGFILIMIFIHIKRVIIFFVEIYQNFAPITVREKCRFYPSCSDYMIMSLKKYGFFKGFPKGIKRMLRCKYPNGGYDYP